MLFGKENFSKQLLKVNEFRLLNFQAMYTVINKNFMQKTYNKRNLNNCFTCKQFSITRP